MEGKRRSGRCDHRHRAFTLTELMVVVGLISLLISLLLPVVGKARAAANATACISNLRQMGTAWLMYVTENNGRLPEYVWNSPSAPENAWRNYWTGILESYRVKDNVLRCRQAADAIPYNQNRGYGNVNYAWTGRYAAVLTAIHLSAPTYRESSYGYNRFLNAGQGFGADGKAAKISAVRNLSDVPVFMDAAYPDFRPVNGTPAVPAKPPPNLRGDSFSLSAQDQWDFLIARHGRGINVVMADGSARWVPLEDTYQLRWKSDWIRYSLPLPAR
jgi:prepilin-type N-terminal cleavage/methylation domain-containing protein/prepilin-type processing-associated H-X9-DG protein